MMQQHTCLFSLILRLTNARMLKIPSRENRRLIDPRNRMWRFRDGAERLDYGHLVSLKSIWRTNHSSRSSDMLAYVRII